MLKENFNNTILSLHIYRLPLEITPPTQGFTD